jgi:hypothetical protein
MRRQLRLPDARVRRVEESRQHVPHALVGLGALEHLQRIAPGGRFSMRRTLNIIGRSVNLVVPLTELVVALTELVVPLTELVVLLRELVVPSTELVAPFTELVGPLMK